MPEYCISHDSQGYPVRKYELNPLSPSNPLGHYTLDGLLEDPILKAVYERGFIDAVTKMQSRE